MACLPKLVLVNPKTQKDSLSSKKIYWNSGAKFAAVKAWMDRMKVSGPRLDQGHGIRADAGETTRPRLAEYIHIYIYIYIQHTPAILSVLVDLE